MSSELVILRNQGRECAALNDVRPGVPRKDGTHAALNQIPRMRPKNSEIGAILNERVETVKQRMRLTAGRVCSAKNASLNLFGALRKRTAKHGVKLRILQVPRGR